MTYYITSSVEQQPRVAHALPSPFRSVHDLLTLASYDEPTRRYGMEAERMNTEQSRQSEYMSYLMRVWRAPTDGGHTWRASLEEALTQEVHGFKDLPSLFAFLLAQTGQQEK